MKNIFNVNDITEANIKKIVNFFNNSDFSFGVKYDSKDVLNELDRAAALISVNYNDKTMKLKTKDLSVVRQRNNPDVFFESLLHEFRHTNQRMSSNPKIRNAALLGNNNLKNGYKKFHDLVPYEIDADNFANDENLLQGIKNLIDNNDTELLNKTLKNREINNPLFTDEDVKKYIEKVTADSNYEKEVIDESIIALKQMGYSNEEVKNMMNNVNTYDDIDNLLKSYANSEVKLTNTVNNAYDYNKFIENHKSTNEIKVAQSLESKSNLKRGTSSYRFSPEQEFKGEMDFPRYKIDENGAIINKRNAGKITGEIAEEAVNVGNPYFKQVFSGRNLGAVLNLGFAISDYNEARNAGDGVIKAGAKAGAQFVAGEMLGGWMMPVMLAKQVPTIAISAIETTQTVTRKMNSTSRIQTFGEAQFQDTRQLATMRQAGMELAKMSQYNLQQSIMGNEAQYMHRL